jgi:hypothetical protein
VVWDYTAPAVAALLATVFAVSAFGKARDPRGFAASLEPLRMVPERARLPAAFAVLAAEAALVAAFAGYALGLAAVGLAGFAGAALLMAVFTAAVAFSVWRGTSARCHCFGRRGAEFAPRHVLRNAALTGLALAGAFAVAPVGTPLEAAGLLAATATGAVAGVLVIAMDDLVELFA